MKETIVQTALCSSYKKIQELLLNSRLWSLKVVPRAHLPTNKSWSPLIFFVWSSQGQFLTARECCAYRQTTKIVRFIIALIYYKNWEEKRDPSITNYLNSWHKFYWAICLTFGNLSSIKLQILILAFNEKGSFACKSFLKAFFFLLFWSQNTNNCTT